MLYFYCFFGEFTSGQLLFSDSISYSKITKYPAKYLVVWGNNCKFATAIGSPIS